MSEAAESDHSGPGDEAVGEEAPRDEDLLDEEQVDEEPVAEEPIATVPVEEGEELFSEPGGSWWVVAIGPTLVVTVVIVELLGEGQVHWPVLSIFFAMLLGFGLMQRAAARTHVSVRLTETTLRQGAQTIALSDIATVFPENRGSQHQKWESARALGELPAVPRRRKGVGVKLKNGKLAQAWARDVDRFRSELTEAHLAVQMGLEPKKKS